MKQYGFEDKLIDIEPYIPGEQSESPGLIKLNTNENPFPPSPAVGAALAAFDADELLRYPSPDARELRAAVAEYHGVSAGRVFVGNGSDEVLACAFRAFFNARLPVVFPDITYSFYPVWCRLFGIPYREIPLDDDFRIRAEGYAEPNGGVVLCNPNAPTSIGESAAFIEGIVRSNQSSVVIADEAYGEFGGESALGLTEKYANLLVTRSFSKARSLAGLRIGYAVGSELLIGRLTAVKDSFNSYTTDRVAIAAGVAALKDEAYYRAKLVELTALRDTYAALFRERGFAVADSKTNFLFMRHESRKAADLYRWLKEKNILVRYFAKPRIDDYLRVTVGTDEQMGVLADALEECVRGEA
jgi:histidinol-phosphate aminotransferase